MYSKVIKILLLALGAAVLVAVIAIVKMKPESEPAAPPPVAKVQKQYPKRDMLQDTVVAAPAPAPAPVIAAPSPAVTPAPAPAPAPVPAPPGMVNPFSGPPPEKSALQLGKLAGSLKIASTTLQANGRIPLEHSCYRKNRSPDLSWTDAPRGTKSLVVFFEAVGTEEGDSLQWGVYNIPATAASLAGALPPVPVLPDGYGQAVNDGGRVGYNGPCNPRGEFPYRVRVFALDTALALPGGVKKDDLIRAMNGHIIDMAAMNLTHFYRM